MQLEYRKWGLIKIPVNILSFGSLLTFAVYSYHIHETQNRELFSEFLFLFIYYFFGGHNSLFCFAQGNINRITRYRKTSMVNNNSYRILRYEIRSWKQR